MNKKIHKIAIDGRVEKIFFPKPFYIPSNIIGTIKKCNINMVPRAIMYFGKAFISSLENICSEKLSCKMIKNVSR